jgi:hypothetical protein
VSKGVAYVATPKKARGGGERRPSGGGDTRPSGGWGMSPPNLESDLEKMTQSAGDGHREHQTDLVEYLDRQGVKW